MDAPGDHPVPLLPEQKAAWEEEGRSMARSDVDRGLGPLSESDAGMVRLWLRRDCGQPDVVVDAIMDGYEAGLREGS